MTGWKGATRADPGRGHCPPFPPADQTLRIMPHSPHQTHVDVFFTAKGHTSSLHHFVDFALNVELRVFGFDTFKLDGNFFSRSNVRTLTKKEKHEH